LVTHLHLVPRSKKQESYTFTPVWAFVACSRVNFTLSHVCYFVFWFYSQFITLQPSKLFILPPKYPSLQNILTAATQCYRKARSPQTDPSFPTSVPFPSRGSLSYPDDVGSRFLRQIRHIRNIAIALRWFCKTLFENQRHR
jgi:hypothetical protein